MAICVQIPDGFWILNICSVSKRNTKIRVVHSNSNEHINRVLYILYILVYTIQYGYILVYSYECILVYSGNFTNLAVSVYS